MTGEQEEVDKESVRSTQGQSLRNGNDEEDGPHKKVHRGTRQEEVFRNELTVKESLRQRVVSDILPSDGETRNVGEKEKDET